MRDVAEWYLPAHSCTVECYTDATEVDMRSVEAKPGDGFAYFHWRLSLPSIVWQSLMGNPHREQAVLALWRNARG